MNDEGQTFNPKDVYRQLAEEQARGAALREALAKVDEIACRTVTGNHPEDLPEPANRDGEELAKLSREAIALPADSTALDAALTAEFKRAFDICQVRADQIANEKWAEGRSAGIESMRGPMHDQRRIGQEEGAATERAKTAAAEARELALRKEWRARLPCGRRSHDHLTCDLGFGHGGFHGSTDGARVNWPESEAIGWDHLPPALAAPTDSSALRALVLKVCKRSVTVGGWGWDSIVDAVLRGEP